MIPLPNNEQKEAIEHFGGVLLSAGAGSGKTFVIVEHIIFLLKNFKSQVKQISLLEVRGFLKEIVIMTFTRKAAGELEVRLKKRIKIEITQDESEFWDFVLDSLDYCYLGTIHGLCHKILSNNILPFEFPESFMLISAPEFKFKIKTLVDSYFDIALKNDDSHLKRKNIFNALLLVRNQIYSSMIEIFYSPELRILWGNPGDKKNILNKIFKNFLNEIDCQFIENFNISKIDPVFNEKEKLKAWYKNIEYLSNAELGDFSLENLQKYQQVLDEIKRVTFPKEKEEYPLACKVLNEIKTLKSFLKKNADDLENYKNFQSDEIQIWSDMLSEIFSFIDKRYLKDSMINFSDLEYYVYKSLEDISFKEKLNKLYKYFIVDEFQDTSYFQYEILKKLSDNDFAKLFCVGDVKQAIYGFRGGELGVFLDCQKKIEKNLTLKNNYRSDEKIINFNNRVFKKVLDKEKISSDQKFPEEKNRSKHLGEIVSYNVFIDETLSLKKNLVFYEARILKDILVNKDFNSKFCILYKKLTPSWILIDLLVSERLGFSAQMKISFKDEPIIALFFLLLEGCLDSKKENLNYLLFSIQGILHYLNVDDFKNLQNAVDTFYQDADFLDMKSAFLKFLFNFGIVINNIDSNLKILNSIILLSQGEVLKSYKILSDSIKEKLSIEFQFGEKSDEIIIMTSHSSKGLEFENLILAGISNNGRTPNNSSYIGKFPQSFKWKKDAKQKKPYKTPALILESLIDKKKESSESKRLFYVACTRAVQSLHFVNFYDVNSEVICDTKNSWSAELASCFSELDLSDLISYKRIELTNLSENENSIFNISPSYVKSSENNFFRGEGLLRIIPELSVTRLCSLIQCPRKFYLENICKISEEDLDSFPEKSNTIFFNNEEPLSSAERGIKIHGVLSDIISKKFQNDYSLNKIDQDDQEKIVWAINLIKELFDVTNEFISEKTIKFSFFGHMITGVPDLVIKNESMIEIWDFKTGAFSLEKENEYKLQLMIYAYAYCKMSRSSIQMKIIYLDEMKYSSFLYNKDSEEYLFDFWKNINNFSSVNKKHCPFCLYSSICL